jgi:hypothetical protein
LAGIPVKLCLFGGGTVERSGRKILEGAAVNTPGNYRNIYDNVNVEIEASVAWVTLNRPSKRNAISPALSADMLEVLRDLNADPEVRVLVLTRRINESQAQRDRPQRDLEAAGTAHDKVTLRGGN